jgi:hypothetical protein
MQADVFRFPMQDEAQARRTQAIHDSLPSACLSQRRCTVVSQLRRFRRWADVPNHASAYLQKQKPDWKREKKMAERYKCLKSARIDVTLWIFVIFSDNEVLRDSGST